MTSILRPLLPLLLLFPFIALSGAAGATAPIGAQATGKPVSAPLVPAPSPAVAETVAVGQPAIARVFTITAQSCVRTGNRMIC